MTAIADRPTTRTVHPAHAARTNPRATAVHHLSASLTAAGLDPVSVDLEAAATDWLRDHGSDEDLGSLPKERPARRSRAPTGFRGGLSPWDVAVIPRG